MTVQHREPRPWSAGSATGIGSLPGTDLAEALRTVLGELPDLPHLPELPARGPSAAITGRTAALLAGLSVELHPSGWRFCNHPGLDARRATAMLRSDLDLLEELAADHDGPLKLQAAGVWTLAATTETRSGNKALADAGARRDLAESLAEGLTAHVAEVARRLPRASLVLQLDEPALPSVLAGRIPTASGFSTLSAVPAPDAADLLGRVVHAVRTATGVPVAVHCCAPGVPVDLLRRAGADAIALDTALLTKAQYDPLAEAVETGASLWLGATAALPPEPRPAGLSGVAGSVRADGERLLRLWRDLGLDPDQLAGSVVVTPACGLAGASPAYARAVLERVRQVGAGLR